MSTQDVKRTLSISKVIFYGEQHHRELAREAIRKSLLLLKNGKPGKPPILLLSKNANKILVAGTHAHNLGYQCDGWTIEWQGVSGNNWTAGRPVVIEPYLDTMDALVPAWLPRSEVQGVADVLFGDYEFTGKLARTWFKRIDQLPTNQGDPNYDPLFLFGFGLKTQPRVEL
ncbi:hypothetical protein PTKIN_Ptkin09bG0190900 [Pterospermum kingtungense]